MGTSMAKLLGALLVLIPLGFAVWSVGRPAEPQRLKLASQIMAAIATFAAIIIPALVLAKYLFPEQMWFGAAFAPSHLVGTNEFPLTREVAIFNRAIAFACATVPLGFAVWALLSLRRLFLLYARREVFSEEAPAALATIAWALCCYVLASVIAQAPITLAFSLGTPDVRPGMSLSLQMEDLTILFFAGTMRVLTRVIAQARGVAEENASFV